MNRPKAESKDVFERHLGAVLLGPLWFVGSYRSTVRLTKGLTRVHNHRSFSLSRRALRRSGSSDQCSLKIPVVSVCQVEGCSFLRPEVSTNSDSLTSLERPVHLSCVHRRIIHGVGKGDESDCNCNLVDSAADPFECFSKRFHSLSVIRM